VAAARAALEAKHKEAQESTPVKKKPLPKAAAVAVEPMTTNSEKPSTPKQSEQRAEPIAKPQASTQPSPAQQEPGAPPKTRRAMESDALSRIDTFERDAADQEFSKFDQGPLVEQPAFVPDSPTDALPTPKTEIPQSSTNGTNGHATHSEAEHSPETSDPQQDRWKAIREAAAERIGANEHAELEREREPETELDTETTTRTSQSERTDEGDTSGEESKFFLNFY
jgi:hypothetical protein